MARTNNLTNFLTDVSSAIKQKTGDNTPIPASDFDTEILSIETAGNYQSKTLNITQNGNYNLLPDQDYDAMSNVGISVNVPTGEDLETEISAQEEYIAQLEAIIDTKAAGSGDGSSMNIFVQLAEPATKKGLWLKTDNEFEHVYGDDDVVESESWYPDGTYRNIPYSFYAGATVTVGTDIYLLGGYNSTSGNQLKNNFKYDTLTDTYTGNRDMPFACSDASAVSIGTDIYILGLNSNGHYKYDTLTNTYTQLTNIPYSFKNHDVPVAIGTDIYIFGGNGESYYRKAYKYDTLTDTYTQLTNIPYGFTNGSTAVVGTNVYLFGGSAGGNYQKAYKYDTLTDTYTQLTNIPYQFYNGSAITVGTDIYLFGGNSGTTNTYKYNTLTNAYTQLTNIPYGFVYGSASIVGNKIYLFGGRNYLTKVQCMQVVSKTFEDNSVVISQGRLYNVGYATEIFSNNLAEAPLLYAFADAWFYTTQDGLITDIPSYYGDGTQWINFKNPPVEEVEE